MSVIISMKENINKTINKIFRLILLKKENSLLNVQKKTLS